MRKSIEYLPQKSRNICFMETATEPRKRKLTAVDITNVLYNVISIMAMCGVAYIAVMIR